MFGVLRNQVRMLFVAQLSIFRIQQGGMQVSY